MHGLGGLSGGDQLNSLPLRGKGFRKKGKKKRYGISELDELFD